MFERKLILLKHWKNCHLLKGLTKNESKEPGNLWELRQVQLQLRTMKEAKSSSGDEGQDLQSTICEAPELKRGTLSKLAPNCNLEVILLSREESKSMRVSNFPSSYFPSDLDGANSIRC